MPGFGAAVWNSLVLSFGAAPSTIAWAFLTVIGATFISSLVVRRRLDHLDLVGVLKTRE